MTQVRLNEDEFVICSTATWLSENALLEDGNRPFVHTEMDPSVPSRVRGAVSAFRAAQLWAHNVITNKLASVIGQTSTVASTVNLVDQ